MLHIFPLWITICTTLINFFDILAVVELLIKTFYHYKNKNYSSNYKSIIITSPIGFDIVLTNDEATLKQRWCAVVSTLCNVVSKLFERRALTLYQRYAMLEIRCWILFHFQRRINVIHNVETMLIRH